MDYDVHINNGSEARPIVLRLLPGEETIFNLKVVNHGEPSNITLEASDPVFKAVRLKKPDSYVVMEEIIPVMARMPEDTDRLDGELLLTSNGGRSRVPISLLSDGEDPGDAEDEPGERRGEDSWDDLVVDEDEEEDGKDSEPSPASEDLWEVDKEPEIEPEEEQTPARRIEFSRNRDLQSYKAASRPRKTEEPGSEQIGERIEERIEEESEELIEDRIPAGGQRAPQSYLEALQDSRKDSSYVSREPQGDPEIASEVEEEIYEPRKGSLSDIFMERGALQIIPAGILLALIFVLVMTFITESIPEFPGALASSILIVTLIIYGAATLLKA